MFYYLNGTITLLDANLAVVDCGGVGYACHTTNYTLARLQLGKPAKLFTYFSIKENAVDLFGFSTREELNCFEHLLGVTGVGPKAALAILSVVSPEQLTLACWHAAAKQQRRPPRLSASAIRRRRPQRRSRASILSIFLSKTSSAGRCALRRSSKEGPA